MIRTPVRARNWGLEGALDNLNERSPQGQAIINWQYLYNIGNTLEITCDTIAERNSGRRPATQIDCIGRGEYPSCKVQADYCITGCCIETWHSANAGSLTQCSQEIHQPSTLCCALWERDQSPGQVESWHKWLVERKHSYVSSRWNLHARLGAPRIWLQKGYELEGVHRIPHRQITGKLNSLEVIDIWQTAYQIQSCVAKIGFNFFNDFITSYMTV